MAKEALIVKRDFLFKDKYFEGFLPVNEYDFIPIILENFEYHLRGEELENNSALQQIIPYVWIIKPKEKRVFAYKRASGKQNYQETRLMNKVSCGVGGHIDREDSDDPIQRAMMRELMEEVSIVKYPQPKVIGYLNDDSDSVGKVHFGVVAIAETTEDVKKKDNEMVHGQFYSIEKLEAILSNPKNDVEKWTRFSWPFVKDYLNKI